VDVVFVHPDHLDSPRAIVNAAGEIVWRWESSPYGDTDAVEQPNPALAPLAHSLRFPGQVLDKETGAHYNYFRDYDPATGRYLQSDPIGVFGGLSVFGYTLASPIDQSDDRGLAPGGRCPCQKGALGVSMSVAKWTQRGCVLLAHEVVVDAGGVTTRLDSVFFDPSNGTTFGVESKCGPCARLSRNQRKAFPAIRSSGGAGRGPNAAAAGLSGPFGPLPIIEDRWP
jgi:RHS repeat-associated protein